MKRSAFASLITLTALVATSLSGSAFAETFTVDPAHSNVDFTIRHLVSKVRGHFNKFEGTFDFDPAKADMLQAVKFSVDAASIDTGNADRDKHLRSADFFNVEKHPTITFVSKKASKAGDKKFKLEGDLTMLGKTKPVTWDVDYMGIMKNMTGVETAGFTATTKVNRKDWGINWNKALDTGGVVLGDEVELIVNLESTKGAPAAAKPAQKAQAKEEKTPSDMKKK